MTVRLLCGHGGAARHGAGLIGIQTPFMPLSHQNITWLITGDIALRLFYLIHYGRRAQSLLFFAPGVLHDGSRKRFVGGEGVRGCGKDTSSSYRRPGGRVAVAPGSCLHNNLWRPSSRLPGLSVLHPWPCRARITTAAGGPSQEYSHVL